MEAIEGHIQQYFGNFETVFHELSSPDIHVDICVVPPSEEHDYYTLVTMGMGAHRMNVPEELAEYKLERAELAIALPKDWKLKYEDLKDERWYWPIRLLKDLARLAYCQRHLAGLWPHSGPAGGLCRKHQALRRHSDRPPGHRGWQRGLHPAERRGGQLLPGDPPLPGMRWSTNWPTTRNALLDKMEGHQLCGEAQPPGCHHSWHPFQ